MPHVSIRFRSELYHIAPYDVHRQQDQENNKQGAEGTPLRETEDAPWSALYKVRMRG